MAMSPTLLRPRATGFNPKSIAGLSLWLDASDDAQFTVDVGVTTWRDKSGNSRNATQTTGTKQPIRSNTINGRKVVTFQGVDDTMSVANVSDFNATSQTIIVVSRQTAAANQALFYKASSGGAVNGVIMRYRAGTEVWLFQKNDGVSQSISNQSNTNTNTSVYSLVLTPTTQNGWVNGTQPANGNAVNSTAYDDTAAIFIGSRRDIGEYLNGDVCEVLCWPRALSTAERQRCERYLGGKWGITVA
jgi:hypothetical protein